MQASICPLVLLKGPSVPLCLRVPARSAHIWHCLPFPSPSPVDGPPSLSEMQCEVQCFYREPANDKSEDQDSMGLK